MPELPSAEENIDNLLAHFLHKGDSEKIQAWRQRIEEKEARSARRPSQTINAEQAVQDFRHALLWDIDRSESAKALLSHLLRPTQTKPRYVDFVRLQNPAHRPTSLSSEQQAYVNWFDRTEQDRRKYGVEISLERWDRWGHLEEAIWGYKKLMKTANALGDADEAKRFEKFAKAAELKLRTDVVKAGEQWFTENHDLAHELVDQAIGKAWVTGVPTKSFREHQHKLYSQFVDLRPLSDLIPETSAESPVHPAQEAFYKGRIYYVAAILILKNFGLDDQVARSVMNDIQQEALQKWSQWHELVGSAPPEAADTTDDHDARVRACEVAAGRVYWDLYNALQSDGIYAIQVLEKYLSKKLSNLTNDPDQADYRTLQETSTDAQDTSNSDGSSGGDRDQVPREMEACPPEIDKERTDHRPTLLQLLKTQLTPRQLTILSRLSGNTHEAIAYELKLNKKTIQRELRHIEAVARKIRSENRL